MNNQHITELINNKMNKFIMEITYENSYVLKNTQSPLPSLKFYMATSYYLSFFRNI